MGFNADGLKVLQTIQRHKVPCHVPSTVLFVLVNIADGVDGYITDKNGISHWVIISEITDNYVKIINPLLNRNEYYEIEMFRNAIKTRDAKFPLGIITPPTINAKNLWETR